jgi:hypothetical protein
MNTSGESTPSPAPSSGGKNARGRPRQGNAESQQQKIERIRQELRQAEAALKVSEEKRASIVGAAVIRHARHHTEFARHLTAALRAEVKAKADRTTVADLLDDAPAP